MAKRRRSNKGRKTDSQRGYNDYHKPDRVLRMDRIQDRRRWMPSVDDEYRMLDGRHVSYEDGRDSNRDSGRSGYRVVAFSVPKKVLVCKRREERRRLLFARNKVGKGKKVSERRRMREDSRISCRRR